MRYQVRANDMGTVDILLQELTTNQVRVLKEQLLRGYHGNWYAQLQDQGDADDTMQLVCDVEAEVKSLNLPR